MFSPDSSRVSRWASRCTGSLTSSTCRWKQCLLGKAPCRCSVRGRWGRGRGPRCPTQNTCSPRTWSTATVMMMTGMSRDFLPPVTVLYSSLGGILQSYTACRKVINVILIVTSLPAGGCQVWGRRGWCGCCAAAPPCAGYRWWSTWREAEASPCRSASYRCSLHSESGVTVSGYKGR